MNRWSLTAALTTALIATVSCSSPQPSHPAVTVLARSDHCGLNLSWQRIQATSALPANLPSVGIFEDSTTLVISLGSQPTGGFEIILPETAAPNPEAPGLRLDVRLEAPADGIMVTQALTSPCVLIRIATPPTTPLQVHFSGTAAEAQRER